MGLSAIPVLADLTWFPFSGLPPAIQVLFPIAFLIIVMMLVWTGDPVLPRTGG